MPKATHEPKSSHADRKYCTQNDYKQKGESESCYTELPDAFLLCLSLAVMPVI